MSSYPRAPKINFSRLPLLWAAIFFCFGIGGANFLEYDWKISLAVSLCFSIFSFITPNKKIASLFVLSSFAFLGALVFQSENRQLTANHLKRIYDEGAIASGEPLEIEGVIRKERELAANGFFFELKAESIVYKNAERAVLGTIKLFAPINDEQTADEYERMNLQGGSRIRAACRLSREEAYLNPGVFSRIKMLDEQQIAATATIKSPLLIEKLTDAPTFSPLNWIYRQRETLIIEFRDKFNFSTAGILIASLLGNKYFLDKPTADIFREGGTFHVLVISGLHITFIGGLMLLFFRLLIKKTFWQFSLAVFLMWIYTFAVGAQVPVVRATVMFTILIFSKAIYRDGNPLNALGACALILLVWRPNDLFTSSFQLTFASVAAIVATAIPLIENLRKIGKWSPSAENPFPPLVPAWLRKFCETLYWSENAWEIEQRRQLWSAKLFKNPGLKWLDRRNLQRFAQYLFEGILVSLIVQIWLLPFLVVYFHRISIVSVLLNLWVGFFIALESFAGVFAVFLAQISDILALPFIKFTEILNSLLLFVPRLFVEADWASIRVPHYSGEMKAIYFIYFLPILILTVNVNRWNPFALIASKNNKKSKFVVVTAACLLFFGSVIVFHPFSAPSPDGQLHIDFLDVGQGDSALITLPNGETLLVDGGGKPIYDANEGDDETLQDKFEPDALSIGETVVSSFLWEKGYSQIDYILATHADADHMQGLTAVAENFRVRAALIGAAPIEDRDFAELFGVLQKKNIEIINLKRGDVLDFETAKMEILYPPTGESPKSVSSNNQSIVFRLTFGNKKILFTGDIEKEAESNLLVNPAFLQADIIKVAHHGSQTSSTQNFINAVNAEYAIIPVGKNSSFGHPHKEVVERWTNSGARIITTGERGTISFVTDGRKTEIQTFVK